MTRTNKGLKNKESNNIPKIYTKRSTKHRTTHKINTQITLSLCSHINVYVGTLCPAKSDIIDMVWYTFISYCMEKEMMPEIVYGKINTSDSDSDSIA